MLRERKPIIYPYDLDFRKSTKKRVRMPRANE